jgi:hypothetical protein
MKLQFFSHSLTRQLRDEAESNFPNYGSDCSWFESFVESGPYLRESRYVVDPPPVLLLPDDQGNLHDAENARRIFSWLKGLSPSTAMEERLWACLTHSVFPGYLAKRWPVTSAKTIGRRYLLEGQSFAALSRNGISRLWWAGYLTIDEGRRDPFELTDVLFLRQDIQVSLLERSIGKCHNVRHAVLDFFLRNREWLQEKSFGKRIQVILRELNLLGGVMILDGLPAGTLEKFLDRIAADVAKDDEKTTAIEDAIAI